MVSRYHEILGKNCECLPFFLAFSFFQGFGKELASLEHLKIKLFLPQMGAFFSYISNIFLYQNSQTPKNYTRLVKPKEILRTLPLTP